MPRPFAWARQRGAARDGGIFQVIEAMIIGFLILGAITISLTLQAPPPPSSTQGVQEMETATWDALRVLDDMYYNDTAYSNSTLSKAVAEAMAGSSGPLVNSIDQFMPTGSAYNVYLSNGYDRTTVFENRTPTGETIGVSYPFEPNWNHVFTEPEFEIYDPAGTTTMGLFEIPLFNANLVTDQGESMRVEFVGNQSWVPGALSGSSSGVQVKFDEAAYTTVVQGGPTDTYSAASIYLQCQRMLSPLTVEPCYAVDLSGNAIDGYDPQNPNELAVTVKNYGAGTLAAGTPITVRLPVGLSVTNAASATSDVDALWTNIVTQTSSVGPTTVTATLASSLATGEVARLNVDVSVDDARYSFKTVDAYLGGDSVSSSHFLVRINDKPTGAYTGGDYRIVLVSGPKPVGDASTTPAALWGFAMPMPFGDGVLKYINITLPDSAGIITNAQRPSDFNPQDPASGGTGSSGTVTYDTKKGNWINYTAENIPFSGNSIVEFQLEITFDGSQTQASPRFPFAQPRPVFDGYNPRPTGLQFNPGVWYSDEPPQTATLPGYGRTLSLGEQTTREIQGRLGYRNTLLTGTTDYSMVDLSLDGVTIGAIRDALKASEITPAKRTVGLGHDQDIHLDFRDLATVLAEEGGVNNLNITTRLYPPWGVRDRIALETWYHEAASGLVTSPNDLEPAWLDGDTSQDIVVASQDGNVYAISGSSGATISGASFRLPESGQAANPAGAVLLSRAMGPLEQVYAVGTTAGSSKTFSLDSDINERFGANKNEADVATIGVNTSADFDGDGHPEIVVANDANQNGWTNAAGLTRITVYDGDAGSVLPGWETDLDLAQPNYGRVVNGSATQIGMGTVGADARNGLWLNTGLTAGLGLTYDAEATLADIMDDTTPENIKQNVLEGITVSWGVYDSGIVAFGENGRYMWNFTGGRMVRLANANVQTPSTTTGFVGGGGDGWAYGLDAKKAITPVTGLEYGNIGALTDLEMANPYEGYFATSLGMLTHTRSGWTTLEPYTVPTVVDGVTQRKTLNYVGINAVDTLDADPWTSTTGNGAAVSWWAGDAGVILRSTDRLQTIEEKTLTAQLQGVLSLQQDKIDVSFTTNLPAVDLTTVDFVDVHAASTDEAWFVGHSNVDVAGEVSGYVVHTFDGGSSFYATQLDCTDANGIPVADCHVEGIESDGDGLWIVGSSGMVLAQMRTGDAELVDLVTGGTLNDGRVALSLTASQQVELKEISIEWDPNSFDWMREVRLASTDIWDISDGAAAVTGTVLAGVGAGEGAAINLKLYDDTISGLGSNPDNNLLSGTQTLEIGPFKHTAIPLLGYYGQGTNGDFSQPTNFFVTLTFGDGTQDVYVVGVGSGAVTTREASASNWGDPAELDAGYISADDCFGLPDPECGQYHAIDFTTDPVSGNLFGVLVGEPQEAGPAAKEQHALTTLPGGSTIWRGVDLPIQNVTLHDGAINAGDVSRWVVAGENDRVIASYDYGITWTDLPKIYDLAQGAAAPLYAVEFDHNDVAYVAGGSSTGILWTVDGYTEWGRASTQDLYTADSSQIKRLFVDTREMVISQGGSGIAEARVEVWDEDLDGGTWVTLHDPQTQWPANQSSANEPTGVFHYDYADATQDVRFRFTLSTPMHGFSRFSPQVRGQLDMKYFASTGAKWNDAPQEGHAVTMDLNGTTFATGGDLLEIVAGGALRLPAVHNPWVYKLYNPDTPDPGSGFINIGARTGDMDISADGNTAYVGTEGLYNIGAAGSEAPVGYDNSLYAIDVTTGRPVAGWSVPRFDDPIRFVRAHDNGVYVITQLTPGGTVPTLYNVTLTGEIYAKGGGPIPQSFEFATGTTVHDMVVADLDTAGNTDVVVGVTSAGGTEGWVYGINGDVLAPMWNVNPALRGVFDWTYQIPLNAMYGGHILETSIIWTLDETLTSDGSSIVQTGRVFNAFNVAPPNEKVSSSPTYSLEVVAWLQDWG